MADIIDISANEPHEIAELICILCHLLKDIECKCGAVGCVIKTGQTLEEKEVL